MRRIPRGYLAVGLFGMAVTLGADGTAPPKAEADAEERAKFDGTWEFTSMEYDGKPVPSEDFRESRLIFKGERYTVKSPQLTFQGTYAVDPASNPRRIDVTFEDGPNEGQVSRGIYKLEGDTYTSCMALAGRSRPTSFSSTGKGGGVLQVAKRVKP